MLSRLQFGWVIGWHILLPAITVGLTAFIAMLEGLNFLTGRDIYLRISTFWIKIAFGMGVVTGGDGPGRREGADRGDHAEIETAEG
ncbi:MULTISPECIES: cytochrome ubiquinol oxidase subunit I [unclassified Mesorhizobium]|uniref:cytochrome ubiquinol oxidase subunit I n=1 Tax=unclassified Mesorhizobium TaxID=325217 RepID=UPI0019D27CDF|nr:MULTISPECIES: cytochrome ubiquinol oxidase subunit I [unclassified Mesorhizobium]